MECSLRVFSNRACRPCRGLRSSLFPSMQTNPVFETVFKSVRLPHARLLSLYPAQQAFPCGLGAKNEERESKTARKMAQVKEQGGGGEERKKKNVFWVCQSDARIYLTSSGVCQFWKKR